MRSGWQQPPPDADHRRPPFGPEVSWPTGYYELDYREGAPQQDGYPEDGGGGPYGGNRPYGEPAPYGQHQPYGQPPPNGQHPYRAQAPAPGPADYGDPGYTDPRYEGPGYQRGNNHRGAGPRGDRGRPVGGRFPDGRSPGGRFPGDERLGNQWSGAYPALPGAANDPRYDDPRLGDPPADVDAWYDEPGYDDSGYDAPGYDQPRQFVGTTQFEMPLSDGPGYEQPRHDGPRYDETRFDLPRFDEQRGYGPAGYDGGPAHDETRFDMPALGAPVIEPSSFEVDVYRDADLATGPRPANMGPAWSGPGEPERGMLPHTGMMLAVEDGPEDWTGASHGRQGAVLLEELDGLPRTGQFEALEDYPQERRQKKVKAPKAARGPRIGRRRGSSRDRRQWFIIGAVIIVAAGAIAGVLKFAFPSHSGPAHTMTTPNTVGAYTRKPNLEQQMNVGSLVDNVRKLSGGQATNLVSGVYQAGSVAPGATDAQIFMFIGGHLANADPASSINGFIAKFPGAQLVTSGPMGGKAACVEDSAGAQGKVAMCTWFDNDSFGELVSPTMTTATLQNVLLSVRPSLEVVAKQ